jgi:hypothetical protein
MRKRILSLVLAMTLAAGFSTAVSANTPDLSFQINENDFVSPAGEQNPYVNADGRTMVPIRFVGNALGVDDDKITWDADSQTAKVQKDGLVIEITVGKRYITQNGMQIQMDTAAEMTEGRLFIPVRYISEALGAKVEWDAAQNRIFIMSDSSNNLVRYASKKVDLPVKFEGEDYMYTLNQLFIIQAGTDEFNNYVKNASFSVESDTTFLIKTNFTLKNKGSEPISWSKDGSKARWFISETHGNILDPIIAGAETLNAGQEAMFNQVYASKAKSIDQLILYFETKAAIKDLILFH